MSLVFPLSLPRVAAIESMDIGMVDSVGYAESPYTFTAETQENPGKRFDADVALVPQYRASAEAWVTFLAALRGRRGTFLMGDQLGKNPRGAATGSPLVKGAGQLGQTLVIDGVPASTPGWMMEGDWIQIGAGATARLHKVLETVNSNGSGEVTLSLWPGHAIGHAPADNAVITVRNTVGVWRLASNVRKYKQGAGQLIGISFSAMSEP